MSLHQEESVRVLGTEGLFLFASLDTDHDLYLSPEEFKPIAEKLTGTSWYLCQTPTMPFCCFCMQIYSLMASATSQGSQLLWIWRKNLSLILTGRPWRWRLQCSPCSSIQWQKARMVFWGWVSPDELCYCTLFINCCLIFLLRKWFIVNRDERYNMIFVSWFYQMNSRQIMTNVLYLINWNYLNYQNKIKNQRIS